jgi:hypothetical protein
MDIKWQRQLTSIKARTLEDLWGDCVHQAELANDIAPTSKQKEVFYVGIARVLLHMLNPGAGLPTSEARERARMLLMRVESVSDLSGSTPSTERAHR